MADQPGLSGTFYGRWAGLYDLVATAPGIRSLRERAVADLDLSPGDTVVEMGCGTGANFPHVRERIGPDGTLVGVDLVEAMLGQARDRIDARGWENVHVVRGDAARPPLDEVDALLATFVVGMLSDPAAAVRTWVRSVAPGGRLALLNVVRTDRTLARPANLACRAFVRASAPGSRARLKSPTRELERRWNSGTEALFEGTIAHTDDRFGGGFLALAGGQRL